MEITATDWLEMEFIKLEQTIGVHGVMYELIEQAKEMEKQNIRKAFYDGCFDTNSWRTEQYYNETFKQK